jgi:hypothetical protein
MNNKLDLSKYRGNTAEDDHSIISAIKNYQRLTVDGKNRVWTHGGVYIADVHPVAEGEDPLEVLKK